MNQNIDFKHHADIAWQLTLRHLFPLVLLTLVTATVGVLSLGLFAPAAMAGYVSAVLQMVRTGREPDLRDVFSQIRLAIPLLGFSLAALLLIVLGYAVLVVPGIAVSLGITYASLYVIPLMIDRNLGIVDAVKASARIAMAPPVMDNILVALVVVGLWGIGGSVVIGWLFTQPLATIFLVSIYDSKTGSLDAP
ncbi:MAG: hypothetical protein ABIL58_05530 [Pseudomonadota bacterium]